LESDSFDWSKKIVWSNLYKIAPEERKNPNDEECNFQDKNSIELVKMEIEELNPKFCIVLANDTWWNPFQVYLQSEISDKIKSSVIQSSEMHKDTRIIVTSRPFRGDSSNHATKILEALEM